MKKTKLFIPLPCFFYILICIYFLSSCLLFYTSFINANYKDTADLVVKSVLGGLGIYYFIGRLSYDYQSRKQETLYRQINNVLEIIGDIDSVIIEVFHGKNDADLSYKIYQTMQKTISLNSIIECNGDTIGFKIEHKYMLIQYSGVSNRICELFSEKENIDKYKSEYVTKYETAIRVCRKHCDFF